MYELLYKPAGTIAANIAENFITTVPGTFGALKVFKLTKKGKQQPA